ncbi:XdhC family protein [Pantoea sp. B9002]|uniref:XdhC family protein n=1 Tax=Pantoea sp. B9002 TaxID=2726979 RepID=UPI0015A4066E|nr:XdhC family protein [Pantoea sp. B9002]NWA63194.1 XdhC family protein [Pantoea sp. B9002]
MQSLDTHVIEQSVEWLNTGPVWLCTVLSTYGSSPRSPGAMMVANTEGHYSGSLSGGCVEEDFLRRIAEGCYRESSQIVRYGDGGLTPDRALPCGGVLDILIEYLMPDAEQLNYLRLIGEALKTGRSLYKEIILPGRCSRLLPSPYRSSTQVTVSEERIQMTIAAPPRLLIAGLSAVAIYCANFAVSLGFETIVCENRPDVLDNFMHDLPDGTVLIRKFPANVIEVDGCHANTAIVALTHDPRMDDLTLMEAVNTEAFYIGAMGSERNSLKRLDRLKAVGGLTPEEISRIHAPVGVMIGSKTPSEIALAVMADIVRVKNS